MNKRTNKSRAGISWFFAVLCFMFLMVYGINNGTCLLAILGVAVLPLKKVQDLWTKAPQKILKLKPILIGLFFIVAVCSIPQSAIDTVNSETIGTGTITEAITSEKDDFSDKIDGEVTEQGEVTNQSEITESAIPTSEPRKDESIVTSGDPIPTVVVITETPVPTEKVEVTVIPTPTSTISSTVSLTVTPTNTPEMSITSELVLGAPNIFVADIPLYSGSPYVVINDNYPFFDVAQYNPSSFEYYSELDDLGRCGVTYACIGKDIMPTEDRGSIGQVKPTGWQTVKYDIVDGKYLYNRCHLIGFQLTGENANKRNLITGTRSMNVDGMLPFENMVADYVSETGNHVVYRVTPLFDGNNLIATGVLIEAKSVEDDGEGILFNVFVYNVQKGIVIDYATGDSRLGDLNSATSTSIPTPTVKPTVTPTPTVKPTATPTPTVKPTATPTPMVEPEVTPNDTIYVWIPASGDKYHSINNCGRMNPDKARKMTKSDAIDKGYTACSKCH